MSTRSVPANRTTASSAPPPPFHDGWTPGFSLPGRYYWSREQFAVDLERVFYRNWLFAGHTCQVAEPGDFFSFQIGQDSILVVRDEAGEIHALFNSCRHRGSQLCEAERGRVTKFICPYHQWVYGLDGSLQHCRLMNEEVDKSRYPLHRAHVETLHGFIFVCLGSQAPSFSPARESLRSFVAPHKPERIKVCLVMDDLVKANWKTIVDNNRECYHCAQGHREFCLSNFDFGMPGDSRSSAEFVAANERMQQKWAALGLHQGPVNFPNGQWFRCMRFPLKTGFVTESLDGRPVGPILGDFPDHDIGSLRIVGLPNMWFHLNSDYVMTTRLMPVSAAETRHGRVVCPRGRKARSRLRSAARRRRMAIDE